MDEELLISPDDLTDTDAWDFINGVTVSAQGSFWRVLDDSFATETLQQQVLAPGDETITCSIEFSKTVPPGSHSPYMQVTTPSVGGRVVWRYSLGQALFVTLGGTISNAVTEELADAWRVSFDMDVLAGETITYLIHPSGGAGFLSGFYVDVRNPSITYQLPEPVMAWHSDLRTYLATKAGLTALIGSSPMRYYFNAAPQNTSLPYVVAQIIAAEPNYHQGDEATLAMRTIDLHVYGETALSVLDVMEQLRLALSGHRGTMGSSTTVRVATFENEETDFEPSRAGKETGLHVGTATYRFAYVQTAPNNRS